jgi:Tol biopolymer transport system component
MALALGLAPAAHAAFPGKRGLIAFERIVGGSSYVYTVKPDGTRVRRLPCTRLDDAGRCRDRAPVWSRTGRRIALVNATGFALVNADGSGIRQIPVSTFGALELFPRDVSIAPDGQRLVFAADDEDSTSVGRPGDIYVIRTDGTGLENRLTEAVDPAWSVTNRIAFAEIGILVERPGRRALTVYGGEAGTPDWSPRATRIAFSCHSFEEICARRASGRGRVRRLVRARRGDHRDRTAPAWSPDSRYLAYQRLGSRGSADIIVLNLRNRRTRTIRNARDPSWQPRPSRAG